MKITNKKILITGGGSGIGLALAERFVQDGNTVIICGRRETALNEAVEKLPGLISRQCDLQDPDSREALALWLISDHPDLSVLINNAGIQQWMTLDDADYVQRADEEITVNVEAPIHLTSLCLKIPALETIMNVTSGLAFVPLSKVPVYCATKAFLHSYTMSLRHLLKPRNIRVIELIPPALNTDLGGKGLHDFAPPVSGFIESMFEQLAEDRDQVTYGFSDEAANAGPEQIRQTFERLNAPRT